MAPSFSPFVICQLLPNGDKLRSEAAFLTGRSPRGTRLTQVDCNQASAQARPQLPNFQEAIAGDDEAVLKPIAAITAGVTSIVDKVQTLLTYWEKKYKSVWDQDKDAYMRCGDVSLKTPCFSVATHPFEDLMALQEVREGAKAFGGIRVRHKPVQ